MRVIEGSFGKPPVEEVPTHMGKALLETIETMELGEQEDGEFLLFVLTDDTAQLMSNGKSLADILFMIEIARGNIMRRFYDE